MESSVLRRGIGLLLLLVAAILAVLLLMPTLDVGPDPVVEAPAPLAEKPLPSAASATTPEAEGEPEVIVVGDDPSIPVTEKCIEIVEMQDRHVPDFTIMDVMRDRAMLFTEDDLACLTGSSAKPFVLTYAEIHMDKREQKKD